MRYWWVNHKQTFSAEIDGGYVWSPKVNSNGGYNQTYTNLTLTIRGDIVFSYASGFIKAVGIVAGNYREQTKPSEFGSSGGNWSKLGWAVPIDWELLERPFSPKEYITDIAPLLPIRNSPIRSNGNGNQGCYFAEISDTLGKLIIDIVKRSNPETLLAIGAEINRVKDLEAEGAILTGTIDQTERDQLIKARTGQGRFRLNVEKIEKLCRVTKVKRKDLLIASHIKPWRDSNNQERLDGSNGLLLAPHVDKLFDQGWISFTDTGDLLVSSGEILAILNMWGIEESLNVGAFTNQQRYYIDYHRRNIFKDKDLSEQVTV